MGKTKTVTKKSSSKSKSKSSSKDKKVTSKAKTKNSKAKKTASVKTKSSSKPKVSSTKKKTSKSETKKKVSKTQGSKVSHKKVETKKPITISKSLPKKIPTKKKEVVIPKHIRTIADDLLKVLEEFDEISFFKFYKRMCFNPPQEEALIDFRFGKNIDEKTEFYGVPIKKKLKTKLKEPVIEETEVKGKKKKKVTKFKVEEKIVKYLVYEKDHPIFKKKDPKKIPEHVEIPKSAYYSQPIYELEKWIHYLAEHKVLEVKFPFNIFSDIIIKSVKRKEEAKKLKNIDLTKSNKKLLDEYVVKRDGVLTKVSIWDVTTENVGVYELTRPKIDLGTQSVLNGIGQDLTNKVKINSEDITDPKKMLSLKNTFKSLSEELLKDLLPNISKDIFEYLVGTLLHRFYGLGVVEVIVGDDNLEEIAINGANEPISVYHRRYGWLKTNVFLGNENDIYNISAQIGRKVGQQINSLNPIMDAHLLTGDRVASTIFPVSTAGNTITIRRFSRSPWTLAHFVNEDIHLFSKEIAAMIWLAMQYELNILVAGGTAAGKTSVLNVLSSMIAPTNRILTVEDTREIQLPKALQWNWVPLSSKRPNPEGQGEVTMLDLIVAALRMRPDRIIVGEIRRSEQAQALFEAMHTGHSVYATIHADSASQVVERLKENPMNVPETEISALHLIVMQYRDRRTGKRRTKEVAEVIPTKDGVKLNYLFRWQARTDRFEKVNPSLRVFEEIALHTGMTPQEIEEDLKQKEAILQWLVDNDVQKVDVVGEVFRYYYKDPEWLYLKSQSMTVEELLSSTNKEDFSLKDVDKTKIHYSKSDVEQMIEDFYKQFKVYSEANWLKFIRHLDLSDSKINDLLFRVKQEFTK